MKKGGSIELFLLVTIVIIPDVLVTNLITKLYSSCLVAMASHTMLAGMQFSITGTPNMFKSNVNLRVRYMHILSAALAGR